ncbi:hypothetical protein GCM10017708_15680 [Arthrobacter citreus]
MKEVSDGSLRWALPISLNPVSSNTCPFPPLLSDLFKTPVAVRAYRETQLHTAGQPATKRPIPDPKERS